MSTTTVRSTDWGRPDGVNRLMLYWAQVGSRFAAYRIRVYGGPALLQEFLDADSAKTSTSTSCNPHVRSDVARAIERAKAGHARAKSLSIVMATTRGRRGSTARRKAKSVRRSQAFKLDGAAPTPSSARDYCPYKGDESFYHVNGGGLMIRDAAWTIIKPPGERIEIIVAGERAHA